MPVRKYVTTLGENFNSNGNGNHSVVDGALTTSSSPTPPIHHVHVDSRSPSLGATALTPHHYPSAADGGFGCPTTPSFNGVNGLAGLSGWQLTSPALGIATYGNTATLSRSSTPPPFSLCGQSPTVPLDKSSSHISCTTPQRYSHDPYSLSVSQRVSPQSHHDSHALTPNECPVAMPPVNRTDEAYTGPLSVSIAPGAVAVPKEKRNEQRSRRKSRQNDHSRNTKTLPDVPPPTTMRYMPPPPPRVDDVRRGYLSEEAALHIGRRWHERAVAVEPNLVWQLSTPVWVQSSAGIPSTFLARTPLPCPRMEFYTQSVDQWFLDAERWWDTAVRPVTGAPPPPPPPYATV